MATDAVPVPGQVYMMDDDNYIAGVMFFVAPDSVIVRIERKPSVWVAEIVVSNTGKITGRTYPIGDVETADTGDLAAMLADIAVRAADVLTAAHDTRDAFRDLGEASR